MGSCDQVKLGLAVTIGEQGTLQVHIVYEMRRQQAHIIYKMRCGCVELEQVKCYT